jgi:hypothetical protein
MGRQHRLGVFGLVALTALAAVGCKDDAAAARRAEARRALLRGEDLEKERMARLAKERLTTSSGDLLPSDTEIAGIVLPRGFKPKFKFDHEWTYDAALPISKLEKYFQESLNSQSVEHPDSVATEFTQARSKNTKASAAEKPAWVKIYPVPGRSDWSRIVIRAPKPLPDHTPTEAEVRAELARRSNE